MESDKIHTVSTLSSLGSIVFVSHVKATVLPAEVKLLSTQIHTYFPEPADRHRLSVNAALDGLATMITLEQESTEFKLTPLTLSCKLTGDIVKDCGATFTEELTEVVISNLKRENGSFAAYLHRVVAQYEKSNPDNDPLFMQLPKLLQNFIKKEITAVTRLRETQYTLPNKEELQKRFMGCSEIMEKTTLLPRLAGKKLTPLLVAGNIALALDEYRTGESEEECSMPKLEDHGDQQFYFILRQALADYPEAFEAEQRAIAFTNVDTEHKLEKIPVSGPEFKQPNKRNLAHRLLEQGIDHFMRNTNVLTLFADKTLELKAFLAHINASIERYRAYLIRSGMKDMQAELITEVTKHKLTIALLQDYPKVLKLITE